MEKREALYYCGISYQLAVLIPKKKGDGFLKSPFGGHHCNDYYRKFTSLAPRGTGDCVDIDGYLAIGVSYNPSQRLVKDICSALKKTFPHISNFKEIGHDKFYSIVLPSPH